MRTRKVAGAASISGWSGDGLLGTPWGSEVHRPAADPVDFFGRHDDDVEHSGRGDIPYADWMLP